MSTSRGAGVLLLASLTVAGVAGARSEIYYQETGGDPLPLFAPDGVVAVLHRFGESATVASQTLSALPGWRVRSLFATDGASAEALGFTLFAHPDASAELVGFSGVEDAGPKASQIVSLLDGYLGGRFFPSPVFAFLEVSSICPVVIPDELLMVFSDEASQTDRARILAEMGGSVVGELSGWGYPSQYQYFRVRLTGVRTGLELLEASNRLVGDPLFQVGPNFAFLDGCFLEGPSGFEPPGGFDGSGRGGGGLGGPLSIPTLGRAALLAMVGVLLVVGVRIARGSRA